MEKGTFIHATATYTHLGSIKTQDASIRPDIKNRAKHAFPASGALAKYVVARTSAPITDCVVLADSVAISSFTHGAHLWTPTSARELKQIDSVFTHIYRDATRSKPKLCCGVWKRTSYNKTWYRTNRLGSADQLTIMRLRLFGRTMRTGPHSSKVAFSVA